MFVNNKKKKQNFHKKGQTNFFYQYEFIYICSHCHQIITLVNEPLEELTISCPNCGRAGVIKLEDITVSDQIIENAALIDERKIKKIPIIKIRIIGILLVIMGIIILLYTITKANFHILEMNSILTKVSITLYIIGVVIFTFIPNNRLLYIKLFKIYNKVKPKKESNDLNYSFINNVYNFLKKQFDISEKIAIVLILWILFIYFLTDFEKNLGIFLIFVYLGILVIKVFTNELIPNQLKRRINQFTIAFSGIFIAIIILKIAYVLKIIKFSF